jgi:hypothetical protein
MEYGNVILPEPVKSDVRIKVSLAWYASEEEARIAGKAFREAAYERALQGYDFGYWVPGFQGQDSNGLWLAVAP